MTKGSNLYQEAEKIVFKITIKSFSKICKVNKNKRAAHKGKKLKSLHAGKRTGDKAAKAPSVIGKQQSNGDMR